MYGFKEPTLEKLRLIKSFGMSNIVFLNNDNKPCSYTEISSFMKEWYNERLPFYEKRRLYKLKELEAQMLNYQHKIKFFEAVINGIIDLRAKKSEILAIVTGSLGIPAKIYLDCKLPQISKEEVDDFKLEVEKCKSEIDYYTKILATQLWLNDLELFETEYKKRFK